MTASMAIVRLECIHAIMQLTHGNRHTHLDVGRHGKAQTPAAVSSQTRHPPCIAQPAKGHITANTATAKEVCRHCHRKVHVA